MNPRLDPLSDARDNEQGWAGNTHESTQLEKIRAFNMQLLTHIERKRSSSATLSISLSPYLWEGVPGHLSPHCWWKPRHYHALPIETKICGCSSLLGKMAQYWLITDESPWYFKPSLLD